MKAVVAALERSATGVCFAIQSARTDAQTANSEIRVTYFVTRIDSLILPKASGLNAKRRYRDGSAQPRRSLSSLRFVVQLMWRSVAQHICGVRSKIALRCDFQ